MARRTADVMTMATQERADLAEFLTTLEPEQWGVPSLCEGWTVRDVVAHVISYEELGWTGALLRLARAGFSLGRANAIGIASDQRSPAELLSALRKHQRPRGLTSFRGGMVALLDGMIHHQDIRRPLGLPRSIPPERLQVALRFALSAPPLGAAKRARGLTLSADDVEYRHGTGPEVHGPGEAILMALAGRSEAVTELSGPGRAELASRM